MIFRLRFRDFDSPKHSYMNAIIWHSQVLDKRNSATKSQVKPSFIYTMSRGSDSYREHSRRSHRGIMPLNWTQPLFRQKPSYKENMFIHLVSRAPFRPTISYHLRILQAPTALKYSHLFRTFQRCRVFQALTIFKRFPDAHNVQT